MNEIEAREIGARIGQARREKGLSQEQLAEISSFSKRSLQDYEAGITIPYKHLRELSRLLKRTPEWFLYGPEPEPVNIEMYRLLEELRQAVAELRAESKSRKQPRQKKS